MQASHAQTQYARCEGNFCPSSVHKTFFCVHCDSNFCEDCWGRETAHHPSKNPPDGPHEKTNIHVMKRLRSILEPSSNPHEQEALHQKDEDTTWFGIGRSPTFAPIFQDFNRYATIIAQSSSSTYKTRYPQLVSFIGQTGAGKSTVVKMLIDYEEMEADLFGSPVFPSPIVGSTNDNVPTSGDVHLYSDPGTISGPEPMLYADCEGLEGGEREPISSKSKSTERSAYSAQRTTTSSSVYIQKKLRKVRGLTRDITWANTPETEKREYAVTELYPRLLYTFSDVVVFVLRNSKVFESTVLPKLLTWASASLEKSLNQPALPHAVIVLNATDMSVDPIQWDVRQATKKLMFDIKGAIDRVREFQDLANFWRRKGRAINTTQELLECYYSSISVVRIPIKGRYMLIHQQLGRLREEIVRKCNLAHNFKKEVRMLSNSDDFQAYLQSAFDHFSRDLDTPFNFVEVAMRNNPISLDFKGNILKLAIAIKDHPYARHNGPTIFRELSHMVASCMMLDMSRRRRIGSPQQLLDDYYMDYCDNALDDFCEKHWKCSFKTAKSQCNNVMSGHSGKGHQDANAKIIGVGPYESDFSAMKYADTWYANLRTDLNSVAKAVQQRMSGGAQVSEEDAVTSLHHETMNIFYRRLKSATCFISHSTCFSCLREPPEHALPCGHILCTSCVKSFGVMRGKGLVEMRDCPLHSHETGWIDPCPIKIKPPMAGIRVLSLDGGGMRGIVELEVLKAIEQHLPDKIPIQAFFDLIVGTSTGGIIALGLGIRGWSVDQSIHKFKNLCGKAFTPREFHGIPILHYAATLNHDNSKYKTRPLEEALRTAFLENPLFGGRREDDTALYGMKVAVTSTTDTAQQPVIFTNYNRPCDGTTQPDYRLERPDNIIDEIKTWEAARATSAAPPYFKAFRNTRSGKGYLDGALFYNNPVKVANLERKLIWPDVELLHLDILLSIGTGCDQKTSKESNENVEIHQAASTRAFESAQPQKAPRHKRLLRWPMKKIIDMMINRADDILDTEKAWKRFKMELSKTDPDVGGRYHRINPILSHEPPRLDEVAQLNTLQQEVQDLMSQKTYVKKTESIAYRLLATTFFFERNRVVPHEDTPLCSGNILARFENGSQELRELGDFLRRKSIPPFRPFFLVGEQNQAVRSMVIPINETIIENMILNARFDVPPLEISISSQLAVTTIAVCFRPEEILPISGFPRALVVEDSLRATVPSTGHLYQRTPTKRYRLLNESATGNSELVPAESSRRRLPILRHSASQATELTTGAVGGLTTDNPIQRSSSARERSGNSAGHLHPENNGLEAAPVVRNRHRRSDPARRSDLPQAS